MTVATNALLERRGARTALITTKGFRDILEIGRQNRPSLYQLHEDRPPALVPRELRFMVEERMTPEGVLVELGESEIERVVAELGAADVEAVAICLLFGYLHPDHEEKIRRAVERELPKVHVSLSSDVLPEFREYERCSTTSADAYLGPRLETYLRNLSTKVDDAGYPKPLIMQSAGGVVEVDVAAKHPASCVMSGPAGGVVGAAYIAAASGYDDVLTFDMGGTSTDVAPVLSGRVGMTTESIVAGVPIKLPMVDVHTVSAGGGSIAWVDSGGALRVGPRSAGADPGPACYGAGGEEPTVTDANLWLGYLGDGARLGGEVVLDRRAAERVLNRLGEKLHVDALGVARGVVQVANAEMERALRLISVERGLDPRDFALVAFGGAGPMHACALAESIGIHSILVPKTSGVLSALGLAISDLRRDYVTPFFGELAAVNGEALEAEFLRMEDAGRAELGATQFDRAADLRYRGQSFELTVAAGDTGVLEDAFHAAHEQRYGYRMEEEPIEIINLRVVATLPVEVPEFEELSREDSEPRSQRSANFDGQWIDVHVHARDAMGAGSFVSGPALIEFPEATCIVHAGWSGTIDRVGTLILERADA